MVYQIYILVLVAFIPSHDAAALMHKVTGHKDQFQILISLPGEYDLLLLSKLALGNLYHCVFRSVWDCYRLFIYWKSLAASTVYFDSDGKLCHLGNFVGLSPAPLADKAIQAYVDTTVLENIPKGKSLSFFKT